MNQANTNTPGKLSALLTKLTASNLYLLTAFFALALLARLGAVFLLANFDTISGYENEAIARNLVAGAGFAFANYGPVEPTAFMYPLYTFFLAAHFVIFDHAWLPIEITQALIGATGVFFMYGLGARLFDRMTGFIGALAYALYPIYVYWSCQGQALVIEVPLTMAMVLSWRRGIDKGGVAAAVLTGVLFGLCGLSKTLYLALFPAFFLWTRWAGDLSWKQTIRYCAIVLVAAAAVVGPWTIRNAIRFHRLIPVTDNTGFNLWLGNNPHATGGLYTKEGEHVVATISPELRARVVAAKNSPARDDVFKAEAIAYIKERPGRFFATIPGRLRALWYFDPYMPSRFGPMRSAIYLALLPLAFAGMYLSRGRIREVSLFYMTYATMTVLYSIFFGQSRFRFVIEWSLLMFAAYALALGLCKLGITIPQQEERPVGGS